MVEKQDIIKGLKQIGLKRNDIVLVHSAMRTFGLINGGTRTVVAALREILGEDGTLVVPTFTFKHEAEKDPIIDPARDPSEMGVITETVRKLPGAQRSIAYRHSFAAIGPKASIITEVDPQLSVFDLDSSFGKMLELDTKVLILGMTYQTSTSHHFAEYICQVPYRHTIPVLGRVWRPDSFLVRQRMTDYQPLPGKGGKYYSRKPDFNRLGRMLEERGLVGITAIGNAIVRLFRMRDLIELAKVEARKDYNIFRASQSGKETPLKDGQIVLSPEMQDGASRPVQYEWNVLDPKGIFSPARQKSVERPQPGSSAI